MKNGRIKKSMVAAFMVSVLAGSTARAEQGAPLEELESLKRMVQDVILQNEELRRRVRELEAAMPKRGLAPEEPAKAPAEEAPNEPAKSVAKELPSEPVRVGKATRDKIQVGGAIEIEVKKGRNFRGVRSSELTLGTAEFDFEADVVDWAKAELSLQSITRTNSFPATPDDKITVNEALITFAKPSVLPLYMRAGRGVLPFGISTGTTVAARLEESLTITGPLTLEIFEAKEDHVLLGYKDHGFNVAAYVYNGDTNNGVREKHLEHYGFALGYGQKGETLSFDVGIGWMDSVFDTDGLSTAFPELVLRPKRAYTPGVAAYARVGLFGFSLIVEYDTAVREVTFTRGTQDLRTQPAAWQVELGYTTRLFGLRPFGAFNYSKTYQMLGAFPQRRTLFTVGSWLSENIRAALEYANEQDYNKTHGGTNRDSDTWTLRLTYEW